MDVLDTRALQALKVGRAHDAVGCGQLGVGIAACLVQRQGSSQHQAASRRRDAEGSRVLFFPRRGDDDDGGVSGYVE